MIVNHTLTVAELIQHLSDFDPGMPVSLDVSTEGRQYTKWRNITMIDHIEGSLGEQTILISARRDIEKLLELLDPENGVPRITVNDPLLNHNRIS